MTGPEEAGERNLLASAAVLSTALAARVLTAVPMCGFCVPARSHDRDLRRGNPMAPLRHPRPWVIGV
jgi:hypothetical protein